MVNEDVKIYITKEIIGGNMKKILNVSNHILTDFQKEELKSLGFEVVELEVEDKKSWGQLNPWNYKNVCSEILEKYQVEAYHLAGFPPAVNYFCLRTKKECFYAYSERKAIEKKDETGKMVKTSIFEHKGFFKYI